MSFLDRRRVRGAKPLRCQQGVLHQSMLEARRCNELHYMQMGGLIRDLEAHPQPSYTLAVNDVHICRYLADFRYYDNERQQTVVEDTKGWITEVAKLKLRLMAGVHGINVELVRKAKAGGWR